MQLVFFIEVIFQDDVVGNDSDYSLF